jgi:hypothetical protein
MELVGALQDAAGEAGHHLQLAALVGAGADVFHLWPVQDAAAVAGAGDARSPNIRGVPVKRFLQLGDIPLCLTIKAKLDYVADPVVIVDQRLPSCFRIWICRHGAHHLRAGAAW